LKIFNKQIFNKQSFKENELYFKISSKEYERLKKMTLMERDLKKKGYRNIAGIDEAGRGPLAGPVVAAICLLNENYFIEDLNDSKKLSLKKREKVYENLKKNKDIAYSLAVVNSNTIDEINILQATFLAMRLALKNLFKKVDFFLIDGIYTPVLKIPHRGIKKGDSLSVSIAAASVIAKCERDKIMREYHEIWPWYGFLDNKGYGTKKHIKAIYENGVCDIHRKSFEPVKSYLKSR
jgi:ribonuclease HII